jgi:hypothetical protein
MYCVELAVSVAPAALSSEFWPAQMIASVVPSGLSCDHALAGDEVRVGGRPGSGTAEPRPLWHSV